jgi:hypothetical protein
MTVTHTRYNVLAILGWTGLAWGLINGVIQYNAPSAFGVASLTFGFIIAGITVSFAGPWKSIEKCGVDLQPPTK